MVRSPNSAAFPTISRHCVSLALCRHHRHRASDPSVALYRSSDGDGAARSGCQIGAVLLHVPIRGARALLNSLALAYRPAPFGEADTVVRQPECAELLQRARLLEPGMECNIHESEPVAEDIRSPSGAPCHHLV